MSDKEPIVEPVIETRPPKTVSDPGEKKLPNPTPTPFVEPVPAVAVQDIQRGQRALVTGELLRWIDQEQDSPRHGEVDGSCCRALLRQMRQMVLRISEEQST